MASKIVDRHYIERTKEYCSSTEALPNELVVVVGAVAASPWVLFCKSSCQHCSYVGGSSAADKRGSDPIKTQSLIQNRLWSSSSFLAGLIFVAAGVLNGEQDTPPYHHSIPYNTKVPHEYLPGES
eukprot:scaffold9782_cov150-Amphora_coffeaeformis.AAC.6